MNQRLQLCLPEFDLLQDSPDILLMTWRFCGDVPLVVKIA
jgi:hypothetical protein